MIVERERYHQKRFYEVLILVDQGAHVERDAFKRKHLKDLYKQLK